MSDNVYNINTWVECPKRYDLYNVIRKYCIDKKINIHRLEAVPCSRDWVDKLIGNSRETIYIHISGGYDELNTLKVWMENKAND